MGRAQLQQISALQDAFAHLSPDAKGFMATAREHGMKAAIERRDAPFGEGRVG
jgi:enoyl-CoA hydratase